MSPFSALFTRNHWLSKSLISNSAESTPRPPDANAPNSLDPSSAKKASASGSSVSPASKDCVKRWVKALTACRFVGFSSQYACEGLKVHQIIGKTREICANIFR